MKFLARLTEGLSGTLPDDLVRPQDWRRRLASLTGALLIGLLALGFAWAADLAQEAFSALTGAHPYSPLVVTPAVFVLVAVLTRWIAPAARGSGIPQVIAASRDPEAPWAQGLLSLRAGLAKVVLSVGALLGGAAVGREGPRYSSGRR